MLDVSDHPGEDSTAPDRRCVGGVAFRLIAALLVGIAVAVLAFVKAWGDYCDVYGMNREYYQANAELQRMGRDIELLIADGESPPLSLGELDVIALFAETDAFGNPIDPWSRPYGYEVDGDEFRLWSYGYDGRPGGSGMNSDLYYKGDQDWIPTLQQFLTIRGTGGIQLVCGFGGLFAGVATWVLLKPLLPKPPAVTHEELGGIRRQAPVRPGPSPWKSPLVTKSLAIFVTIVFSIFGAAFISFLHVPSGH